MLVDIDRYGRPRMSFDRDSELMVTGTVTSLIVRNGGVSVTVECENSPVEVLLTVNNFDLCIGDQVEISLKRQP